MLIQAWNIQAGGGNRMPAILAVIAAHGADTLVLSEATRTRLPELIVGLQGLGYKHLCAPQLESADRGVIVASRATFQTRAPSTDGAVPAHRWCEVWFPDCKFRLAGLYLPDTPKPIAAFWPHVHHAAIRRGGDPYLLMGDLNSGQAVLDAEHGKLTGDPWFTAMAHHGMHDLWRHKHRDAREYSWYSAGRAGKRNGFRLDHAFGTLSIRSRVRDIRYSHVEREQRISDHSSLLLKLR